MMSFGKDLEFGDIRISSSHSLYRHSHSLVYSMNRIGASNHYLHELPIIPYILWLVISVWYTAYDGVDIVSDLPPLVIPLMCGLMNFVP
jgi:hypothetical protein